MLSPGSRALPRPFTRPRIEVPDIPRTWRTIPVEAVQVGDVVVDVGRVLAVRVRTLTEEVQVAGPEVVVAVPVGTPVRAFVPR